MIHLIHKWKIDFDNKEINPADRQALRKCEVCGKFQYYTGSDSGGAPPIGSFVTLTELDGKLPEDRYRILLENYQRGYFYEIRR